MATAQRVMSAGLPVRRLWLSFGPLDCVQYSTREGWFLCESTCAGEDPRSSAGLGWSLAGGARRDDQVRVLDCGRELRGIVSAWIDGWDPGELVVGLRDRRINQRDAMQNELLNLLGARKATVPMKASEASFILQEENAG